MIISASRRTDIPAFFGDWFINRIKEGFAMYRNPMRPSQVFAVSLLPEDVDAIVFWTKNPKNFLEKLKYLENYIYYFQFTITPYGKDIEPNIPPKDEVVQTFIELSNLIGKKRVIWRYDPIIITDKMPLSYHKEKFEELCEKLAPYTQKCIISYVDFYSKAVDELNKINAKDFSADELYNVFGAIGSIGKRYNLSVETCAEDVSIEQLGLKKAHCVDGDLIRELRKEKGFYEVKEYKKDNNQRKACGCAQSIDLGIFNTCKHFCTYCYANFSRSSIVKNVEKYDEKSPLLCSYLDLEKDEIRIKEKDGSRKIEKDNILQKKFNELKTLEQRSFCTMEEVFSKEGSNDWLEKKVLEYLEKLR
ncbi:uncharacterized protein DUF1848 [Caldicellulosiruptor bescii]|uniref:DUF1848 domain-containing protein n=2 Tax=Caldicellulosiruptor bescii TaxID=31899 RepID=B9MPT2_CALBD|nr:DUF1848 domain-containing protein [Caldicellulosiruptor bescii]ACM61715.1 Domain of unknown function DUF1848 [Caldicellulosiruptor bescii DSM 6725]PBC88483.1 uncharacterized protein DUF1848 [Caldicellulosiruptor bescii]PBC92036.1 uncharacterized protein DUF1848 [Caldicellulosiruptor bescii]PBD02551.1 uncharacterized protein DUF1848 [Caldicellulosiruptor bescii]PBD05215.1 uncharacterized protein DUF1848 [Caldicellulosiruptor bescii]